MDLSLRIIGAGTLTAFLAATAGCAKQPARNASLGCDPVFINAQKGNRSELAGPRGDAAERTATTVAGMQLVQASAGGFCVDSGRYPRSVAELEAAQHAGANVTDCAFDPSYLVDGWGRAIKAEWSEHAPRLRSAGPDGQFATADDIISPDSTSGSTAHRPEDLCRE
jgi:hypothetical protein